MCVYICHVYIHRHIHTYIHYICSVYFHIYIYTYLIYIYMYVYTLRITLGPPMPKKTEALKPNSPGT